MPIKYVGKPPAETIESDVSDIKAAVEDIQAASGNREETLTLLLAPGDDVTNLLTNDPTTFKEPGTDVTVTTPEEIFRYVVDTSETAVKTVRSINFEFAWQTTVVAAGAASGESYWEIGTTDAPTTWRRITDIVPASEEVTDHFRSGNFLPPEATSLPFTIRLVGRVFVGGDALRTDVLSTSKVTMTYRAV